MQRIDAVNQAILIATGKAATPTGSKLDQLNQLAIKYYRDWQVEPGVEWDSLYQVVSGGTVTATDTFDLDTDINYISQRPGNYVRVKLGPDSYINYTVVTPQQLYQSRHANAAAKVADNQIKFSKPFLATDQAFGGTIEVPAIIKLDDLTNDKSEVLIDNPAWLPVRMAAQYVLTNKQLNYLYSDILAQANELMQGMMLNGRPSATTSTGIDYFSTLGNVGNIYT